RRRGRPRARSAARRARRVRGDGRRLAPATGPGARALVPLLGTARRDRDLAARMTLALAVLLGFVAGIVAGMFGVGGGLLFVPTLVLLGLGQVEAQATSLAAILPTVAAGTWRQASYGNVRWRPALTLGVVSVVTVGLGAFVAL